ncbi:multidrug effflux MFS transporter [Vibrio sp.]|nr:multidrug effflux MFS transporter [Vibrio sp.]
MTKPSILKYLILLVIFFPMAVDIYLPAFPQVASALSATSSQMKDTISLFIVGFGVGQLFVGKLADLWGRRVVALSGILIYFVISGSQYFVQSIETLTLLRLLMGVVTSATYVSMMAMVKDSYDEKTMPKILSYVTGALCVIPALAPILGAYLTEAFGWRSTFAFMSLYAFVVFFILLKWLPETKKAQESHQPSSSYWDIVSNPTFLLYALTSMGAMAIILAYVSSSPIWLIERLDLSMSEFSFWFSANAAINVASNFILAPYLIHRFNFYKLMSFGLLLIVSSGFLMWNLGNTAFEFMLPIFICSIGFSLTLGIASSKALAPFGNNAGVASALFGFIQMSGAGIVVSLVQKLGFGVPMEMMFHMFLLLPAFLIILKKAVTKPEAILS